MTRDRRRRAPEEQERREARRAFPGGARGALSNVARVPLPPKGTISAVTERATGQFTVEITHGEPVDRPVGWLIYDLDDTV